MAADECLVGVDGEWNGWDAGWLMWLVGLVGLVELIAWIGLVDADGLAFDWRHG